MFKMSFAESENLQNNFAKKTNKNFLQSQKVPKNFAVSENLQNQI